MVKNQDTNLQILCIPFEENFARWTHNDANIRVDSCIRTNGALCFRPFATLITGWIRYFFSICCHKVFATGDYIAVRIFLSLCWRFECEKLVEKVRIWSIRLTSVWLNEYLAKKYSNTCTHPALLKRADWKRSRNWRQFFCLSTKFYSFCWIEDANQ